MPSIVELNDGAYEVTVLESRLSELQDIVGRVFCDCHIQCDYDPTKGTMDDVDTWGSETAAGLNTSWLLQRIQSVIDHGWPVSVACYYYFANCKGLGSQTDVVNVLIAVHSLIEYMS